MKTHARLHTCATGPLLLTLLLLAGCRTYGSYDNREKTEAAMAEALTLIEADAARVQNTVRTVDLVAQQDAALHNVAEDWHALGAAYETLIASHHELMREVEDSEWYRPANRAYGAIIAEHQILERRYQQLLLLNQLALSGLAGESAARPFSRSAMTDLSLGRYSISPPYYARLIDANDRSAAATVLRYGMSDEPADTAAAPAAAPVDTLDAASREEVGRLAVPEE